MTNDIRESYEKLINKSLPYVYEKYKHLEGKLSSLRFSVWDTNINKAKLIFLDPVKAISGEVEGLSIDHLVGAIEYLESYKEDN